MLALSGLLNFIALVINTLFTAIFLTPDGIKQYTIFPGLAILFVNAIVIYAIARQGLTTKAMGTLAVAGAVAGAVAVAVAGAGAGAGAVAGAAAVAQQVILTTYIAWRMAKREPKFSLVEPAFVWLRSLGGTSFREADLTQADFAGTALADANFVDANLYRVNWRGATGIHLARFSASVLQDRRVESLLLEGQLPGNDGLGIDLRGANLDEAHLAKVSLEHADLTGASFRGANLEGANLAEAMCVGTDFTRARLTGACLEAWNIDASTVLDEVDCAYVFLRQKPDARGNRERRPHDPDAVFAPGDFTKLYQKVMTTVEILLRQGVTREAFGKAFAELMQAHPEVTPDSIQSFERKGEDFLLRMDVPAAADKGSIERTLVTSLQEQLRLQQTEVRMLEEHKNDLKEIALAAMAGKSASIVMGDIMSNQDRSVRINGNVTNSGTMSLSGDVHHTVSHLTQSDNAEIRRLGELLQDLAKRLDATPSVSAEDKALAKEKIQEIAAAATKPEDGALRKAGRGALLALKGLAGALPDLNKIVESVGKIMESVGSIAG